MWSVTSDGTSVCGDCLQVEHWLGWRNRPCLLGVAGELLVNQAEKAFDMGKPSATLLDLPLGWAPNRVFSKHGPVGLPEVTAALFSRYFDAIFAQSRAQVFAERLPIPNATIGWVRG